MGRGDSRKGTRRLNNEVYNDSVGDETNWPSNPEKESRVSGSLTCTILAIAKLSRAITRCWNLA